MLAPDEQRAVADAWMRQIVRGYPSQAAETLLDDGDRFLNPGGYALRSGLPVLVEAVLGGRELESAAPVLEDLLRLRAVQDFTPAEAVSFITLLKPLLRERLGQDADVEARIEQLAQMASAAYARCRDRLLALRGGELRRRNFVAERMCCS